MSLKKPIYDLGVINEDRNIFFVEVKPYLFIVKQPQREDIPAMEAARRITSHESWDRYAPFSTLWENFLQLAAEPLFNRNLLGRLYLIIKIGSEVVGFASQDYSGRGEGRAVFTAICIIDKWQRKGVGTAFLTLSEYMGRYFGARRGVAQTRIRSGLGTFKIRQRTGWKEVRHYVRQNREWSEMHKDFPESLSEFRIQLLETSRRISDACTCR